MLTCTGMSQVSALGLHASLAKCLSVYCLAWASCFTILLCSCYEYHLLLKNAQLSVSVIRGWDELLEHALPRSVVLKASRSVVGQAFTSDLFLYQMQMAICMQPSTAQPTTSPPQNLLLKSAQHRMLQPAAVQRHCLLTTKVSRAQTL